MTIKKNKQKNKLKAKQVEQEKIATMKQFLEDKWKVTNLVYTCENCLEEAYLAEKNDNTGYITDEDLISQSNNKLQHK